MLSIVLKYNRHSFKIFIYYKSYKAVKLKKPAFLNTTYP